MPMTGVVVSRLSLNLAFLNNCWGRKDTPTPVIGICRPGATLRRALYFVPLCQVDMTRLSKCFGRVLHTYFSLASRGYLVLWLQVGTRAFTFAKYMRNSCWKNGQLFLPCYVYIQSFVFILWWPYLDWIWKIFAWRWLFSIKMIKVQKSHFKFILDKFRSTV